MSYNRVVTTVLLVGLKPIVVDAAREQIDRADVDVHVAFSLAEVRAAFAANRFDHVVMGGGLPLDERLAVARAVFELSESTTVHMKDRASGPEGYLPFVRRVVRGLLAV